MTSARSRGRLNEIKNLQRQVTEETLHSTREILRLFNESQDAGVRTLELLHHQGAQLNDVGGGLNTISVEVGKANRDLVQLELTEDGWWCLAFCCCCRRRRKVKNLIPEPDEYNPTDDNKNLTEKSNSTFSRRESLSHKYFSDNEYGNGDAENADEDLDKKIDANLTSLFDVLGGLKENATQIGKVITKQNTQLDDLNTKAAKDQSQLSRAQRRAQRLL